MNQIPTTHTRASLAAVKIGSAVYSNTNVTAYVNMFGDAGSGAVPEPASWPGSRSARVIRLSNVMYVASEFTVPAGVSGRWIISNETTTDSSPLANTLITISTTPGNFDVVALANAVFNTSLEANVYLNSMWMGNILANAGVTSAGQLTTHRSNLAASAYGGGTSSLDARCVFMSTGNESFVVDVRDGTNSTNLCRLSPGQTYYVNMVHWDYLNNTSSCGNTTCSWFGASYGALLVNPAANGSSASGQVGSTIATGTGGAVKLTWDVPAVGDAPIMRYEYRQSSDGGASWSTWSTATVGSAGSTTYVRSGLEIGSTYIFQVRAVNNIGPGEPSLPSEPVIAQQDNTVVPYVNCGLVSAPTGFIRAAQVNVYFGSDGNVDVLKGAREFSSVYGTTGADVAWPGDETARAILIPYSQYYAARFVVPPNSPVDTWTQTFGLHGPITDTQSGNVITQAPAVISVSPCSGHFVVGSDSGVDPRCIVQQNTSTNPNALQIACKVLDPGETYTGALCPLIRGQTYYLNVAHWDEFDGNTCDDTELGGCSIYTSSNTKTLR